MVARRLAWPGRQDMPCRYVTMGGSELFDIANVMWVGRHFVEEALSFESNKSVFNTATRVRNLYEANGLKVDVANDDFFSYERTSKLPHVYFVDLKGTFTIQYVEPIKEWLANEIFVPGDVMFITSIQARYPLEKAFNDFQGEYAFLGVADKKEKQRIYYEAHPSFILARALREARREKEIELIPLGCIKYNDIREAEEDEGREEAEKAGKKVRDESTTSPMGIYGFLLDDGITDLRRLVEASTTFDTIRWLRESTDLAKQINE